MSSEHKSPKNSSKIFIFPFKNFFKNDKTSVPHITRDTEVLFVIQLEK